jgi:methionyl-tRNA formyltransferase
VTNLYVKLVLFISNLILNSEELPSCEQDEHDATYSLWRDENDYEIDWTSESSEILRFIDAVGYPFKGASTYLNGDKVRIDSASICKDVTIEARLTHLGKIIFMKDNFPVVVCGKGPLRVRMVVTA